MRKSIKKILATVLVGSLAVSVFTGCSGSGQQVSYTVDQASSTEVMKVGNETVTLDEVYLFIIQCAYTFGMDKENTEESESAYRAMILEQIQSSKTKYQVALTADLEITEEDEKSIEENVESYYDTFGNEVLDKYGISRDAVKQLFLETKYIEKLENKAKEDLKKDYLEEAQTEYGNKTFVAVDYALFPVTKEDAEGNEVEMSDTEKAAVKEKAEEFRQRVAAGEDLKTLAAEYGVEDTTDTQRTFIGANSEALDSIIKTLKNGDVPDLYEDSTGYMVMYMANDNDTEYRDYFLQSYAAQKTEDRYDVMQEAWLSAMNISEDDIIGDTWENISIVEVADYMDKNKIGE